MKRLALYAFFHKDGILEEYVKYYLKELKTVCDDIMVISNGNLSRQGLEAVLSVPAEPLVRGKKGFDFAAWKAALGCLRGKILEYDEIVLCNCSCYGPVYPFSEMFTRMEGRDCDFWGVYRHSGKPLKFPAHLQSYFLVLRKRLIESPAFKTCWEELKPAEIFDDAIKQEALFTRYFEDRGFTSLAYVDDKKFVKYVGNPSLYLPLQLIREEQFPFVKREIFTKPYKSFFEMGNVSQPYEILSFLKDHTQFPVALIYEDLLKTMQNSALRKILHHTFILPESGKPDAPRTGHEKIALIVFSYFEDLLEETLQYIKNMPEGSDIFIVVVTDQMQELWKQRQKDLSAWQVSIRKQQNRGRNEAAYWLTCRDAIENHDLICVAHDKKTPSSRPGIKGYFFSRHCWDGILKNRDYVQNVLALFRREPQIGLLMPPPPLFSDWASLIVGNEWGENRELAETLYKRLDLHVPFDEAPAAPIGTMFWVRRQAMSPFFRYPWTVEDFPGEPLKKVDGTLLHALERLYPMIAQEAGYCSGWVMPVSYAGIMYDNLSFGLEQREAVLRGKNEVHSRQIRSMLKAYGKRKLSSLFQKLRGGR